jgi:23S rRNA (adenine2030-N6)-methyltransferase
VNYRHAYHAGSHTEVFKHAVLVLLLQHLRKKPGPFIVLDTHAGAGTYDLTADKAMKTGEALDGIGRVIDKDIPMAAAYLELVRSLNPAGLRTYPGSPAIVQAFLRESDRLTACELREDDAALLRANFRDDRRASVHCRDGYEALVALLPPPIRRGLVFVDPPFERSDEFEQVAEGMNAGIERWPTGIFMAWYPIKDRSGIQVLRARYRRNNPPTLCCELLRQPVDGLQLAGSGLVICNPPWKIEQKLAALCHDLLIALEARDGSFSVDWWIRERG